MEPLGITTGDPDGVGPELLRRALAEGTAGARPVIIYGDKASLTCSGSPPLSSRVRVRDCPGAAGAEALTVAAAELAGGSIGALVTGPVSKARVADALGAPFVGHTEHLARAFGLAEDRAVMVLAGPSLRVALLTHHVAVADVGSALSVERTVYVGRVVADGIRRLWGVPDPRLVVSALNPHGGEGGAFGREEIDVLAPAVGALTEAGLEVDGPLPADTLFRRYVVEGRWSAAICPAHDQALIPLKLLDFDSAINVTLGLPRLRTSPDHGPAYELTGTGLASHHSFAAAIRLAATGGIVG